MGCVCMYVWDVCMYVWDGMCVVCVLVGYFSFFFFFFFSLAQVAERAQGTFPTSETRDALLSPSNQKGGGENAEKVVCSLVLWGRGRGRGRGVC